MFFSKPLQNIQCRDYFFDCHIHVLGSESNHDPEGKKKKKKRDVNFPWLTFPPADIILWTSYPITAKDSDNEAALLTVKEKVRAFHGDKACRCTHKEAPSELHKL